MQPRLTYHLGSSKRFAVLSNILLGTASFLSAQNLVPNPDFEQNINCPPYYGYLNYAIPWIDPATSVLFGTSDYMHTCAQFPVSVPNNFFGAQLPHSGNAYAGIYAWTTTNLDYREYIMVSLNDTLEAGVCYELGMFVSLGGKWGMAVSDLGAYFSVGVAQQSVYGPMPVVPQLDHLGGMLSDTTNWTFLNGIYEALGGESHIVIGNFHDDASTTTLFVDSSATMPRSYYYIDDVSLVPVQDCGSVGVQGSQQQAALVTIDQVMEALEVTTGLPGTATLMLHDAAGRTVERLRFHGRAVVDVSTWRAGLYLYELHEGNGMFSRGKFIKQ